MEADSDSAAWSHWIQDAEPDMLRGKQCFSCTSALKWDADHPCELQATKAESLTWRSILCTAACSPARPTTIAYDCGGSLKAIREKQANRLEFASATRTQYCECLGIVRVKFWLQVRIKICSQTQRRHSDLSHCNNFLPAASADTTAQLWRLPPEKASIGSGPSDGDLIQTLQVLSQLSIS